MQAAVTVAHRVAQEMDTEVGQKVGYAIRFEERTSRRTRIVYLTGTSEHVAIKSGSSVSFHSQPRVVLWCKLWAPLP